MTATPTESEARMSRERLEEISAYYFQTSRDLQHQLDDSRRDNAKLRETVVQQGIAIEGLKIMRQIQAEQNDK